MLVLSNANRFAFVMDGGTDFAKSGNISAPSKPNNDVSIARSMPANSIVVRNASHFIRIPVHPIKRLALLIGKEEQRNELAFAACGKTCDMKLAPT